MFIAGKILTDETPVSEYNIDEKKFIVVMVSKPKGPPPPPTGPSDPTQVSDQPTPSSTPVTPAQQPATQQQQSQQPPASTLTQAESALLMGDEYNTMVQNIVDMGYERPMVSLHVDI